MTPVRAVKLPTSSSELGSVAAPGAAFAGWTVRETTGSAGAVVRFWDNATAASGTPLGTVALAAGASDTHELRHPVFVTAGVYVELVSGSVEGSVYIG